MHRRLDTSPHQRTHRTHYVFRPSRFYMLLRGVACSFLPRVLASRSYSTTTNKPFRHSRAAASRHRSTTTTTTTSMAPKHDEKPSVPAEYKVPDVWQEPSGMGGKFGAMNRPTAGARFDEKLQVGKHPLQYGGSLLRFILVPTTTHHHRSTHLASTFIHGTLSIHHTHTHATRT